MAIDFVPKGFITISSAVDCILNRKHSPDWGSKEIFLEAEEPDHTGTSGEEERASLGISYDRVAIRQARLEVREAQEELLNALQIDKLKAEIDEADRLVPVEYWSTNGAHTTIQTGHLELGTATKPEDRKWQHYRLLLNADEFRTWLDFHYPTDAAAGQKRSINIEDDTLISNNIQTVIQAAKRLWPDPKKRPSRNAMARELSQDPNVKNTGYREQTIRKILSGSYAPAKIRGIPGLPGIDTRVK